MAFLDTHGIRLSPHHIVSVERGRMNSDLQNWLENSASAAGTFYGDHTFGTHLALACHQDYRSGGSKRIHCNVCGLREPKLYELCR